jgi:hypothetical protein
MNTQNNLRVTRPHITGILPAAKSHRLAPMGREFDTARDLQDRMTPSAIAPIHGVECFAHCRRERPDGGFFDLFRSRGNEVAAVVGNIDGCGIAGSILLTGVQAALRCMVRQGVDLPEAVTEINRLLWELAPDGIHGALLSARVDPLVHHLRYINAGHQTAIVIRRDRSTHRLEPNAAPLALSRASSYRELRIRFGPGDTFIAASGDIDCEHACEMITGVLAPRARELAACIAESCPHSGAPTVVVISWRDPEDARPHSALAMAAA